MATGQAACVIYFETYSPITKLNSIRGFMAICRHGAITIASMTGILNGALILVLCMV